MKGNKTWKSIRKAFHRPFTTSRIWGRRCRSDGVIEVSSSVQSHRVADCSTEFYIISHKTHWVAVQWLLVWNWSGLPQIRGSRYPQISPIFTSGWYHSSKCAAFCVRAGARCIWGIYLSCGDEFLWAVWFFSAAQRFQVPQTGLQPAAKQSSRFRSCHRTERCAKGSPCSWRDLLAVGGWHGWWMVTQGLFIPLPVFWQCLHNLQPHLFTLSSSLMQYFCSTLRFGYK